ncbi:hypothetical protein ACFYST_16450 [Kitasatospora sp. NPDC004614]|uniref:hypothetical protein n=1 Tax=unclassified Kitasatospora TaxID=2633591 RepID=UPI0036AAD789
MSVKPVRHPHRFWARVTLPTLAGGLALIWLTDRQLGWTGFAEGATIFVLAALLMQVIVYPYRTRAGAVGAVLALVLLLAIGFVGTVAYHQSVLAEDGERTLAEVTAVHPSEGRAAGYCLLRAADGRGIPGRLGSCEGRKVGDHLDVTYDPAGRQDPTEEVPDPSGAERWVAGLSAALALLVLLLPLWGLRGRSLEGRKR